MSMDTTKTDEIEPEELDTEAEDLGSESPKGQSVKDAVRSAWDKHSAEEDSPKPEPRLERRSSPVERRDAAPKPESAPVTKPTDTSPSSAPPQGWSSEAKADWVKLPPSVQAAVTKRETDMTEGAKQLQTRYGGIHKAVQDLGPIFQKLNVAVDKGFENMVSWFRAIEANPKETIVALAKQYNVDLGAAPSATSTNPSDPRLDSVLAEVNALKSADSVRQQVALNDRLNAWSATKPHFEAVRGAMANIVNGALASNDTSILDSNGNPDLDKVYDQAIWLVPEVREKVLAEQAAASAEARRAVATKSRTAASSVKPRPPGDGAKTQLGPKKGESVRDSIKRVWGEIEQRDRL